MKPKLIACDGEVRSQHAWSRHLGGSPVLVRMRLKRGWPACRAATMPLNVAISRQMKLVARQRALRRLVRIGGRFQLKRSRR